MNNRAPRITVDASGRPRAARRPWIEPAILVRLCPSSCLRGCLAVLFFARAGFAAPTWKAPKELPLGELSVLELREDDPAQPASMTLMGGPIDTRISPTAVNTLANSHDLDWFRQNAIMKVPFMIPCARITCSHSGSVSNAGWSGSDPIAVG